MASVLPTSAGQTTDVVVRSASQGGETQPLEQRLVLYNVSWDTYERLSAEIDNRGARLTYDKGVLEIMTISPRHEYFKTLFRRLFEAITEELRLPCCGFGSTTWRSRALEKGLEPDECYYLANEPKVRGKKDLDLSTDPPPDLAIEVENTQTVVDRLGIDAALGIGEVWRFDGEELIVLSLQPDSTYTQQAGSNLIPADALRAIVEWVGKPMEIDQSAVIFEFRHWVRENLVKAR
jgi:Uma2 family endonuclease